MINSIYNIYSFGRMMKDKCIAHIKDGEVAAQPERIYPVNANYFGNIYNLTYEPSEIIPRVYLGNAYNASNYETLKALNIHTILNITNEIPEYFPDDFKYLACIESTLNYRAVSSARAVGMWQFIPETARQYGLEVNDEVDERYNVEKETEAACKYLNYAYSIYGDWATAAASYNTGYARISKELLRQSATSGLDLWLVDETMRYVFRILACKEFLKDPQKYGFYLKKEQLYAPFITKDTLITGKISNWPAFAKDSLGVSYYDLKSFNTWIRSDSLVNLDGNTYKITLPVPESRFFDKKQNMPVHQKNWVIDAY